MALGDDPGAEPELRATVENAERMGLPPVASVSGLDAGHVFALTWRTADALAVCHPAVDEFTRRGDHGGACCAHIDFAHAHRDCRRAREWGA